MLESLREQVAAAARTLAAEGLALGAAGNVSAREGDLIAVTPTGAVLATVEASDVAIVDRDGHQREGALAPTSELALHLAVYREHDAGAVVHAHPPVSTVLACVVDELPAVHYQIVALGGPVRVAPYATFGTEELAESTLGALAGRTAALMANHGSLAYGDALDVAVERTRLLEWLATVYWRAASLGPPRILEEASLDAVREQLARRRYPSLLGASGRS